MSPNPTYVDEQRRVIAWNRALEEMTGVPKQDILGKGDYAYSVPFRGKPEPILVDHLDSDLSQIPAGYERLERHNNTLLAERYVPSTRPYGGFPDLDYPLHDRTVTVTTCGRICFNRQKDYDLGYFDDETCRLEPLENPFGPKVLPMFPE